MPHVQIPSTEIKVVLLGSSHTGKSSLVTRFSEGYYRNASRPATVGASFVTKRINTNSANSRIDNIKEDEVVKIQIWDTAGSSSFKPMACMFYKDANAVIVCYDVGCRRSYDEMRDWLEELRIKATDETVVAIAALKVDLLECGEKEEMVPQREVEALADTLGVIYVPTSAKSNQNVGLLFQTVAEDVLRRRRQAREMMILQKNQSEEMMMMMNASGGESSAVMNRGENYHHEPMMTEHRDAMDIRSGRDSPRRSKYDKQRYKINTSEEFQKNTPPRTPKRGNGKSKTKISAERKKRSGSRTPRRSNRDNTLLEAEMEVKNSNNEAYGCCQGVEGGSGCIVS
jgi:small GTP-binding protein